MRHYVSLADSKYLPQLLVLYESLKKHSSEEFTLYVLPMDEECYAALDAMKLEHAVLYSLRDLEHLLMLRRIRESRTWQEYCWTMASVFTDYLLHQNNGPIDITDCSSESRTVIYRPFFGEITYIDSDCAFFSDPKVIHDEIGDRSIAVIPHRLIPSKKHLEVNGKFNVSWVTFKNNPIGRECLSTWAAQCREKCSATDGCGDQKYLDAWPVKYGDELCVIQHPGAGVAPWNLASYVLSEGPLVDSAQIIFYHAHEYIHGQRLTNYELRPEDIQLIYKPYIEAVTAAKGRIEAVIA